MGQTIRSATVFGMVLGLGVGLTSPGAIAAPKSACLAQTASSLQAMAQSVNTQINRYRASRNLPSLTLNSTISQQAQIHSQNMARGQVPFSHNGFQQRAKIIGQAIAYRSVAENVAFNQGFTTPDQQAVQGWIKSAGHHKNIVGSYNLTGIGVACNSKGEFYFTQIFVQRP